jgi:hypothetical protein
MSNNSGPFYGVGRYMCEITDQGLTAAKTGTLQIALKFKVLRCTQPEGETTQYERTTFLAVTENTLPYLVPKLEAIGYTRDGLKYLNLDDPQCHDLRGTGVEMFCKHENDQDGKLRERWDIASSQSKPLELNAPDAKALRAMDQLYGRAKKNAGLVSKPASARPAPAAASQEVTLDDIPF